jgi:hypothetical protein
MPRPRVSREEGGKEGGKEGGRERGMEDEKVLLPLWRLCLLLEEEAEPEEDLGRGKKMEGTELKRRPDESL